MKATGWKQLDVTSGSGTNRNLMMQTVQTTAAPDAHLLSFQRIVSFRTATQQIRCACLREMPQHGARNYPITLADGTRHFVSTRDNDDERIRQDFATTESADVPQSHPLGIPMSQLMANVQAIRRKREHEESTKNDEKESANTFTSDTIRIQSNQLWVDKHAPATFVDLLSDERTNREVLRSLRAWDPYVFGRGRSHVQNRNNKKDTRPDEQNRVILLSGTPGVGKTTLAHILAKQVGYRPMEINASDERTASVLMDRVFSAMESQTLEINGHSKPNCLILDEIDGVDAKHTIPNLVKLIRAERNTTGKKQLPFLRRPIILICNNRYVPALKPLLPYAKHYDVLPPPPSRLVARLRAVLASERLTATNIALNQLVSSSGGDIRSCLYTLQFAATRAFQNTDASVAVNVDMTRTLMGILNGTGLKDERKDIVGTLLTVFQKKKVSAAKDTISRVIQAVETYGDSNRMLDYLFLNAMNISFIDPTFDRSAALHEWLSFADISRSEHILPATSAALHLFCRVEQRPPLMFSLRENAEIRFQQENNRALIRRFAEGVSPHISNSTAKYATEVVPFLLWALSMGEGAGSLSRAVSSREVLHAREQKVFDDYVSLLNGFGLSYRAEEERQFDKPIVHSVSLVLDPPIDRLVQFNDQASPLERKPLSFTMKKLLTETARREFTRTGPTPQKDERPVESKKRQHASTEKENDVKRTKSSPKLDAKTFLGIQARKVKEARSAKTAARVGGSAKNRVKVSHTGSNVPLSQVVRLKYVKGFTQAVRTPCQIDDLL